MDSQHNPHLNSCISSNSVKNMAESIGLVNLDGSITNYISEDLSYKISILLQEAEKFSRHEKRKFLSTKDFSKALINKNMEPFYGFSDDAFIPFKHAYANNKEFYFNEEIDMDLTHIALAQLPKIPLDSSLKAHWLCIEGIQPMIPENIAPGLAGAKKDSKLGSETMPKIGIRSTQKRKFEESKQAFHGGKDSCAALYQEEDALSMEQQLYYRDITEACVGSEEIKRAQAFQSLATDPGLHQLLPRFTAFVSDGVKINVIQRNLAVLIYLMRMVRALLENPYLTTDPLQLYLHELVPAVLSCALSRQICQRPEVDNHWALRDFAAKLLAQMCKTFGTAQNMIQTRTTALMSRVLDRFVPPLAGPAGSTAKPAPDGPAKAGGNLNGTSSSGAPHSPPSPPPNTEAYPPLVLPQTGPTTAPLPSFATLYGALSGLAELGPSVTRTLLGPRAKPLAEILKKRLEATPLNQNPVGLRAAPQTQQQQLIAERVAIEHVKQILARACAAIHKSPSSSATASIVTMEELKEEYGPHLAPLVYTQIKKAKQQQQQPAGPGSTSGLNMATSHKDHFQYQGPSQSQFVSQQQQLNSQLYNASQQPRFITSQSPYSIPSQNRASPFSQPTISNQYNAANLLQQQHQQRLQLTQNRLILNHAPPGPTTGSTHYGPGGKTTSPFAVSHPPLNQFQSSVPYRIQHQSSVRQGVNNSPPSPLTPSTPISSVTTGPTKPVPTNSIQQQSHLLYNNALPSQATHTLPGLVNRNGPTCSALSLQSFGPGDATPSSSSNTQNGAALARLSASQQFHQPDDDCSIISSTHPRPSLYPEPAQNFNGDVGSIRSYDPTRTKDGPDNSVLTQKIPNYPHKYMPNLGTTPSNFR